MVAALSDRPKYAEHAALHATVAQIAQRLSDAALALADEDSEAYAEFAAALKLPRDDDAQRAARAEAIGAAARRAAEVPLRTVAACRDVAALAEALAGRSNANASSDLVVATLLANAAAQGAAINVRVNLPSVTDAGWAADAERQVAEMVEATDRLTDETRAVVEGGQMRPPVSGEWVEAGHSTTSLVEAAR